LYSYNTLTASYFREWPAMLEYDLTIPLGLLKCMAPKRAAHECSKGVLPFKYTVSTEGLGIIILYINAAG
jgi:hypothetical protein